MFHPGMLATIQARFGIATRTMFFFGMLGAEHRHSLAGGKSLSKPIQECQGSSSILDQAACFIENAPYQQAIVTLEQRLTMTPMDDEIFYLLLWDWALVRNAYYDLDEEERLPVSSELHVLLCTTTILVPITT